MSTSLSQRDSDGLETVPVQRFYGPVRRLGSGIGLGTVLLLDLLALDDITTAGAWMPEIGFLIASVPALITLAYFLFRSGPERVGLEDRAPRLRAASRSSGTSPES